MRKGYVLRESPALGKKCVVVDSKQQVFAAQNDKGFRDILNVDQFSGQPFMVNSCGFLMNDIMMFENAQSDSVARTVLQRIKNLAPQSMENEDFSASDAFDRMCPANYGSPAEYLRYQERLAELDYNRVQSLAAKRKAEQDKISFTEHDTHVNDNVNS